MCLLQTKSFRFIQKYYQFPNIYMLMMVIELSGVQLWTEIKLVITNRTPASRSCDFVITRLISVQIALHSVQLPSLTYICWEIDNFVIKSDIFRRFFICKNILKKLSCYHDNYFRYFMFGKYNGFVSKARVSACMYFLVYICMVFAYLHDCVFHSVNLS